MDELTALQVATLVLGIIGAVTGVAAILWNVLEFVLAGPRIKVELSEGRTDGSQLVTGSGLWSPDAAYAGLDLPHRVVAIEVANTGRAPVTVASAGIKYSNGTVYMSTEDSNYRLDAHSRHTWCLPFEQAAAVVTVSRRTNMPTGSAQGFAHLATGKEILSKRSLAIPE